MKYGYFDDAAREYVIARPDTPYPWINYLGEEDFFSLMSNTSGGYSFYKDARMLRLTRYRYNNVPTDAGGKYYYINENGDLWTPGWMPATDWATPSSPASATAFFASRRRWFPWAAPPRSRASSSAMRLTRKRNSPSSPLWSSACGTRWTT